MRCHRLILAGLLPCLTARIGAQRAWLLPDDSRNVSLEVGKTFFKSPTSIDFASFYFVAQGRFPLNQKVALTVGLPFSRASITPSYSGATTTNSTALGNPWIGAEIVAQPDLVIEAGIRPGIASDASDKENALVLGSLGDFDRLEAWAPKTTSVRAVAHIGRAAATRTFFTGILGGTVFFPAHGGETQYFANYGLRLGFREDGRLATLALTGRANLGHLTEGGSLDARTVHQLTFRVERTGAGFRPFGSIASYLDEGLRKGISAMVAAGASFTY